MKFDQNSSCHRNGSIGGGVGGLLVVGTGASVLKQVWGQLNSIAQELF